MEWFISKITSGAIGALLGPIINGLLTAQKQKLDASGSHEARVVELTQQEMMLDRREAEINAAMVIAEQGNWITRAVRPLMAMPVIVVLWKVLIWDKALGEWTDGSTDALDEHLWWVMTTIIVAYMGGRSAEKIADKISGIWKTK